MAARLIVRALALAALTVAACTAPPPPVIEPTPSREPGVLSVTVLLDLSGSRGPRGESQRNALQLWNDHEQSRGGGRVRVRLKFVDVAGSDARLLVELRRAAGEDRADAVIVGVPTTIGGPAFAAAARAAALPILTTLPLPEPTAEPGDEWIFAFAPTPDQIARVAVDIGPTGNLQTTYVAVIEGRAQDPETAALLAEYGRRAGALPTVVPLDRTRPEAIQSTARLGADARRIHLMGAPRDWAGLAPALRQSGRQAGRPGARYVLSYLAEANDLGELRDGLDVVWPAPLNLSLASIPPNDAAPARRRFVQSYNDRHGPPSAHAAAAYDAITALSLAAERVGTEDRAALRRRLEATTFTGIATTYAFAVDRHAGHSGSELVLYRWAGSGPVVDARR